MSYSQIFGGNRTFLVVIPKINFQDENNIFSEKQDTHFKKMYFCKISISEMETKFKFWLKCWYTIPVMHDISSCKKYKKIIRENCT